MLQPPFNKYKDNYWGHPEAPIEIIEYFDYQCEYCLDALHMISLLKNKLGSRVRLVYRNLPNQNIHPMALDAAVFAEAAAIEGKFNEMHELLLYNQKYLTRSAMHRLAERINLDMTYLDDQNKIRQLFKKVILDLQNGMKSGVWSTPTFFINGRLYNGFDDFHSIYKSCLYTVSYDMGLAR